MAKVRVVEDERSYVPSYVPPSRTRQAAPKVAPPPLPEPERKSSWERILEDDDE